jgi:hypothetical protein
MVDKPPVDEDKIQDPPKDDPFVEAITIIAQLFAGIVTLLIIFSFYKFMRSY